MPTLLDGTPVGGNVVEMDPESHQLGQGRDARLGILKYASLAKRERPDAARAADSNGLDQSGPRKQ